MGRLLVRSSVAVVGVGLDQTRLVGNWDWIRPGGWGCVWIDRVGGDLSEISLLSGLDRVRFGHCMSSFQIWLVAGRFKWIWFFGERRREKLGRELEAGDFGGFGASLFFFRKGFGAYHFM